MLRVFQSRAIIPQLQYVAKRTRSGTFLRSLSSSCRPCPPPREMSHLPASDTPWLMVNPEVDSATGDVLERFYSPAENKLVKLNRKKCLRMSNSAHCVGSTIGGWLSYVDSNDCSMYLTNPCGNLVVQLPSLTSLPSVLDVKRDHKTGNVLSLLMECGYNRGRNEDTKWYDPKWVARHWVTNMALSSCEPRDSESVAVSIQGEERRLVYCPIGKAVDQSDMYDNNESKDKIYGSDAASPVEWLDLQENYHPGESYNQAVYCREKERFYTIFGNTGIQAYDLKKDMKRRSKMVYDVPMWVMNEAFEEAEAKRKTTNLSGLDQNNHGKHYYLVAPGFGDLFLVVKHYRRNRVPQSVSDEDASGSSCSNNSDGFAPYKTLHFDLFRVNFNCWSKKLKRVDSFGGKYVFLGLNQSFALSADDVPCLRPNCIYFSDDLYDKEKVDSNWGYDHGIFDLTENRVLPLGFEDPLKVPFSQNYSQFWLSPDYV